MALTQVSEAEPFPALLLATLHKSQKKARGGLKSLWERHQEKPQIKIWVLVFFFPSSLPKITTPLSLPHLSDAN